MSVLVSLIDIPPRMQYLRVVEIADQIFVVAAQKTNICRAREGDDVRIIRSAAFFLKDDLCGSVDVAVGDRPRASSTIQFKENPAITLHAEILTAQLTTVDDAGC